MSILTSNHTYFGKSVLEFSIYHWVGHGQRHEALGPENLRWRGKACEGVKPLRLRVPLPPVIVELDRQLSGSARVQPQLNFVLRSSPFDPSGI